MTITVTRHALLGFTGSPGSPMQRIGTTTLHEPFTFRVETSYAAWYYMVRCEPQTVELTANGYYFAWWFEGKVVDGNIDSRLSGVPITGNQIGRELGEERVVYRQPYTYEFDLYASGELHEKFPETFPLQSFTLDIA